MITFTGRKWDGLRRGQTITLRHATLECNLISILTDGILISKSRGRYRACWLHSPERSEWAALHTVSRHGGRIEDVLIIEVEVPKAWLRRHGGRTDGCWRCIRDLKVKCFTKIIGFEQLAASPVGR
jgi:hypothetical protein